MTDLSAIDKDMTDLVTFGRPRPTGNLQAVCLHTVEGNPASPVENVVHYQATSQTGSYHDLIGSGGRVVAENTDDWVTWSAGEPANTTMIHISFNAKAAWSRAQWLAHDAMLRAGARRTAYRCKLYGFPPKHLTPAELRAGHKGICDHGDTARAWHSTDHTDCGPHFPWDIFIKYVQEYLAGGGSPAPKPSGGKNMELQGVSAAALNDAKLAAQSAKQAGEITLTQACGPGRDAKGMPTYDGWKPEFVLANAKRKNYATLTPVEVLFLLREELADTRSQLVELTKKLEDK